MPFVIVISCSNLPFKAKLKAMPQKTALPINNKIK